MTEKVMLIRHFRDQDNLLYNNDSPIMVEEFPKAEVAATEIKAEFENIHEVAVFVSNKQRAEMTARMVFDHINASVPVSINVESRLREIDQGRYVLPDGYQPGDNFPPLQEAWTVFFHETFKNGNLHYRFGDPMMGEDGCKYPQLSGHFVEHGENQIEFSIRFYNFLIDLCKKYKGRKEVLPVIVTHQAVTARFAEVLSIAEKYRHGTINIGHAGSLPMLEWEQFEEIRGNRDVFIEYGGVTSFQIDCLYEFVEVLEREVVYLKSLVN